MEQIKIRYKRRRLRWNIIFGIFWLILGVISITNDSDNYLNYGYVIIGAFYIVNYLIKSENQYLTIDHEMIIMNHFIPKKIYINELTRIKKISGAYILQTEKTELRIETHLIEKNSLKDLKIILRNLKLKNK